MRAQGFTVEELARFAAYTAAESYTCSPLLTDEEEGGIGIYQEKRLHRTLKHMLCEREACFEVPVGRYVADISEGNLITEIQCGPAAPLAAKLKYYLEKTNYSICVVHPLIAKRKIIRAERESGLVKGIRTSPKKERLENGVAWLYPIAALLPQPRLTVRFVLLETEEYRYSERVRYRKSGAFDSELFPTALVESHTVAESCDLSPLLPPELQGTEFSARDYVPYTSLRGRDVYSLLNVLSAAGLLKRTKEGRSVRYSTP